MQLKSRFVCKSGGSSGNQEVAVEVSEVLVSPGFLFSGVCFTPARQAWAGCHGSSERGHSPHRHSSLETVSSPTRPGAGCLPQMARPSRNGDWCWGKHSDSAGRSLWTHRDPPGKQPPGENILFSLRRKLHAWHGLSRNKVVYVCPLLLRTLGSDQRQPGPERISRCLRRSPCCQQPFLVGDVVLVK